MLGCMQNIVPMHRGTESVLWMYVLLSMGVKYLLLFLTKCLAAFAHVAAPWLM